MAHGRCSVPNEQPYVVLPKTRAVDVGERAPNASEADKWVLGARPRKAGFGWMSGVFA